MEHDLHICLASSLKWTEELSFIIQNEVLILGQKGWNQIQNLAIMMLHWVYCDSELKRECDLNDGKPGMKFSSSTFYSHNAICCKEFLASILCRYGIKRFLVSAIIVPYLLNTWNCAANAITWSLIATWHVKITL